MFRILSIDGGGIRGLIPATVLAALEDRTGRPVATLFDLIAGTSTGGLLACGLTKPGTAGGPAYAARDLAALYQHEGPRIFRQSLLRRVVALGSLLDAKYPAKNIEPVLRHTFGETRLAEALTDVIVPSYELEGRIPWFFRSRRARTDPRYDFRMWQVARATSAAPTYFPPARLEALGPDPDTDRGFYALVDGGVYANNPAMCAYVEALSREPRPPEILMVSVGTGQTTTPIRHRDARRWGRAAWAPWILDVVFDGVSDTIDYQLRHLLQPARTGPVRHYRLQADVAPGEDELDDASAASLARLKRVGEEIVRRNEAAITTLARELVA
ncbi:MAG: patatin-like phospholipase family protein [Gemmatimonadales bacterium]